MLNIEFNLHDSQRREDSRTVTREPRKREPSHPGISTPGLRVTFRRRVASPLVRNRYHSAPPSFMKSLTRHLMVLSSALDPYGLGVLFSIALTALVLGMLRVRQLARILVRTFPEWQRRVADTSVHLWRRPRKAGPNG